jgi:pimeloyl-ACP methyl ester carboxylesterase
MPRLALAAAGWLGRRKCDPRLLRDVSEDLRRPQPDWWDGLPTITAPTLLLAGGPKSYLDQSRFAQVAEALPDAGVQTIAVGHRIHTLAPEPWLETVREFLA